MLYKVLKCLRFSRRHRLGNSIACVHLVFKGILTAIPGLSNLDSKYMCVLSVKHFALGRRWINVWAR